jgi:altronate dehydratase small subunit
MTKYAKLIDQKDNVATAVADCVAGEALNIRFKGIESEYRCNHDIPFGHKIAVVDIKNGEKVMKYGEAIGAASQDIKRGDWVHTHNLKDDYKVLDKKGIPLPGQED